MIPRERLGDGVRLCLEQALRLLTAGRALARTDEASLDESAAILFSYAVEEVGKAALLRDALLRGNDPGVVSGFYSHPFKLRKATELIGEDHLELRRGAFQRGAFQADAFDVGVLTDLESRLSALYVEWDDRNRRWKPRLAVDRELLLANCEYLDGFLRRALEEWTEQPPARSTEADR